ncbi:exocyst complex component Sec5-domain-containing protein [Pseudoneurospora amorphoporcata]|uniref:Exocyst complex component SEC5 n=1 Tax=Pseudoneurospora amorphoporcata TaxID=241081 RepID=A0AAN6SEF4_9PEZI|nr:exocyst complex component Sec5-domain-containing protein [Pseudoneurospora amorphoporcata]
MAADTERTILDFYQVSSLNPTEWPTEKDNNSDVSDDERAKQKANRRKSRFQALERVVSNRASVVPGSETSASGVGNLVQRDEPDPLGTTDSVVRTLKQMGVPLQDDSKLRNRFLLSSTTFSPALFLSQVHATDSTDALLNGLEVLNQSIDQKSASLKVLVESNFERFVRAKATIDNVYKEMKYRGAEPAAPRARAHERHASRSSFRSTSAAGVGGLASPMAPTVDPRKKNALIRESEYGVMGVKAPLLDVSAKAEDFWGPALGGREKEEHLKTIGSSLDTYKDYVEISAALAESIKRKDHESLVEEYNRARRFADEAKQIAQNIGSGEPTEAQLYKILLAARMWHDVDEQIQSFKRDVWRRLVSPQAMAKSEATPGQAHDQHMDLITLLLELGVEENPIWTWLQSRVEYLKSRIQSTAERAKVEIEVLRRRLANVEKPSPQSIASNLRALGRQSIETKTPTFDSAEVLEVWETIVAFMNNLMSPQGILGEVVEFWQTVQGFIDGNTQRTLPVGYKGESQGHHRLSPQSSQELQRATVELVDMLKGHVLSFFTGPPPEDLSALVSPLPSTPNTPNPSTTPGPAIQTTTLRVPINLDPNNLPPPSPKRGEAWEKFAFWPPWSNSISGAHYLAKMLTLVGSGASDMASLAPVGKGDPSELDQLRSLMNAARERCVTALCAAWNRDSENIKYVEDWNRSPIRKDVTKMPASFAAFEGALLSGMQKILYVSEAMTKPGAEDIVLPPATKLLQMVRSQYVTTLYKALHGMVENAELPIKKPDDDWTTDANDFVLVNNPSGLRVSTIGGATIDAGDSNVRMLLTLSNLQALRSEVVPNLNTQFENAFSVKLTDETKTIRDVLGQIDARLFQSYTRPSIESLRRIIRAGVTASDWPPLSGTKPHEVRPYIYEALLDLVLVHTQVSTTAASLTSQVLSFLLEQTSRELLEAFKTRPRYDLGMLMQATLDVEFVAQTLNHYTTDRASELQSAVYQELDSRTDNEARTRLQAELPEMRAVLKRLREASKSEFACFRKPKKAAAPGATATAGSAVMLAAQVGDMSGLERTDTRDTGRSYATLERTDTRDTGRSYGSVGSES